MLKIELHCSSASDTGYLLQIEILKIQIHNSAVNPSNAAVFYIVFVGQCDGRTDVEFRNSPQSSSERRIRRLSSYSSTKPKIPRCCFPSTFRFGT